MSDKYFEEVIGAINAKFGDKNLPANTKYFKIIDPVFKDNFEIKKISDWSLDKGPLLKKDWIIEKLKTFDIYGSPWDLIDFFYSLPINFQIHESAHYIDNIALLKERFLLAYMLVKKYDDGITLYTGRNTTFHDYCGPNLLRDEIADGLSTITLEALINKELHSSESYIDISFLAACFNFFLHTLYASLEESKDMYRYDEVSIGKTKEFFFDHFLQNIDKSKLIQFENFLSDFLSKHSNKSHFYLGFKKFMAYKKPYKRPPKKYDKTTPFFWTILDEDFLSWNEGSRQYYDIHSVYDARDKSLREDIIVIDNMIGACKLIERYSDCMTKDDLDYLRFTKPYLGEITKIKLTDKVIKSEDDWKKKQYYWDDDCDDKVIGS